MKFKAWVLNSPGHGLKAAVKIWFGWSANRLSLRVWQLPSRQSIRSTPPGTPRPAWEVRIAQRCSRSVSEGPISRGILHRLDPRWLCTQLPLEKGVGLGICMMYFCSLCCCRLWICTYYIYIYIFLWKGASWTPPRFTTWEMSFRARVYGCFAVWACYNRGKARPGMNIHVYICGNDGLVGDLQSVCNSCAQEALARSRQNRTALQKYLVHYERFGWGCIG